MRVGGAEKGSGGAVVLVLILGVLVALASPATALASSPVPIPSTGTPPSKTFVGHPATPQPVRGIPPTPQNPFMARNGTSEIHDDAWQTDVNRWGGPLGAKTHQVSNYLAASGAPSIGRDCGSITFDRRGRVIALNACGASGAASSFYLPLGRVKRALELIQQGKPVTQPLAFLAAR